MNIHQTIVLGHRDCQGTSCEGDDDHVVASQAVDLVGFKLVNVKVKSK